MDFLTAPFNDPEVRHSFAAVLAIALSAGPVGVFLMLRRMSLVGDAMSHAILPGVAVGFLIGGLSVFAMTAGGLVAGLAIALLAGAVSRATQLQEDASLAVFLLVSLALGVVIVLDEPFNAIDLKTVGDLLGLVRCWHDEKRTVMAALHDIALVEQHFPQTLLLAREPVAWGDTAQVLSAENLRKAREMCEAFDDQTAACAVPEVA